MNKADIVIAKIKQCHTKEEALELVVHPMATMGFKLTKNEQTFVSNW